MAAAERMKIAFVYDIPYPWHKGGLEYILSVEASKLAERHEVHFFTMRWPGMRSEFTHKGVRYHAFGNLSEHTAYRHGRRSIREAMAFSAYASALFGYEFDVVISNVFPVLHLPLVELYCKVRGARLVLKVDELWDRDYWVDYLGPIAGELAYLYANAFVKADARYVANSSNTARRLEKAGISRSRVSVFAPIISSRMLEREKRIAGRKRKRIIFAGRFIKEKRLDKWLEAVKEVMDKDADVEALLIGEGTERTRIMALAKRLGIEDRLRIRPFFKNKAGLYREIARSKVMLHMSEREGLGIIALESIALGTPVVVPTYSPIPKEVKEMCVVEKEGKVPDALLKIIKQKGKGIKSESNLGMFSDSNVVSFYENLLLKK